jgi:hypothetical protein
MEVGFFFWPFMPELVRQMGEAAERCGYDMVGVADTPGNANGPLGCGNAADAMHEAPADRAMRDQPRLAPPGRHRRGSGIARGAGAGTGRAWDRHRAQRHP